MGRPLINIEMHKDLIKELHMNKMTDASILKILRSDHNVTLSSATLTRRLGEWGFQRHAPSLEDHRDIIEELRADNGVTEITEILRRDHGITISATTLVRRLEAWEVVRPPLNLEAHKSLIEELFADKRNNNSDIYRILRSDHNITGFRLGTLEKYLRRWGLKRQSMDTPELRNRISCLFQDTQLSDTGILRVLLGEGYDIRFRALERIRMDMGFRRRLVGTSYCAECGRCSATNLGRNAPPPSDENSSFGVFGGSRVTAIELPSGTLKRQKDQISDGADDGEEPLSHTDKKVKERLSCIE
jgi:hypothetical protein